MKDAINQALEGFASLRFVTLIDGAVFLQEQDVISKKQRKETASETYKSMLQNVFYAGMIEYAPWEISRRDGLHEGIILLETFERNQLRLQGRSTATKPREDIHPKFELRGLVNCADCNHKLTAAPSTSGTKKKVHHYYFC